MDENKIIKIAVQRSEKWLASPLQKDNEKNNKNHTEKTRKDMLESLTLITTYIFNENPSSISRNHRKTSPLME